MTKYIIVLLGLLVFGCKREVKIADFLRSDKFNNMAIRYKAQMTGYEDEYSHRDNKCYYVVTDTPDFNISYWDGNKSIAKHIPERIKYSRFCAENNVIYGENCGTVQKTKNINYYINNMNKVTCLDKNIILSNSPWQSKLDDMIEKCKISDVFKKDVLGEKHIVAKVSCEIGGAKIKYFYADNIGFIRAVMNEDDIGKDIESMRIINKK